MISYLVSRRFLPYFGPSGSVRCRRNKVSTINGAIFSSLSLRLVTFLPEEVIVGFQNFAWGFNSQKNKIWGGKKIWGKNKSDQNC